MHVRTGAPPRAQESLARTLVWGLVAVGVLALFIAVTWNLGWQLGTRSATEPLVWAYAALVHPVPLAAMFFVGIGLAVLTKYALPLMGILLALGALPRAHDRWRAWRLSVA